MFRLPQRVDDDGEGGGGTLSTGVQDRHQDCLDVNTREVLFPAGIVRSTTAGLSASIARRLGPGVASR